MTRNHTHAIVARRRRPRPTTVSIKLDQLMRHAQSNNAPYKKHEDDWAREWLYEDFTLWAQIKLDTHALIQMMHENEVIAQFNATSNRRQLNIDMTNNPLAYLTNLINKHNHQSRK